MDQRTVVLSSIKMEKMPYHQVSESGKSEPCQKPSEWLKSNKHPPFLKTVHVNITGLSEEPMKDHRLSFKMVVPFWYQRTYVAIFAIDQPMVVNNKFTQGSCNGRIHFYILFAQVSFVKRIISAISFWELETGIDKRLFVSCSWWSLLSQKNKAFSGNYRSYVSHVITEFCPFWTIFHHFDHRETLLRVQVEPYLHLSMGHLFVWD